MRLFDRTQIRCQAAAGHSLPEAIFAVCLVGVMFISLYAGFSASFSIIRSARYNLRATEILTQQTERLRLLNWNQVLDTQNYLRPNFVAPYDPEDSWTNPAGPFYEGTIEAAIPTDWPAAYRDQARLITIKLSWTNLIGTTPVVNQRQIQTCVSRYGMQSYFATP